MTVILITGAAKRIGKAIALALSLDKNNKIIIHYNDSHTEAQEVANIICNNGGHAITLHQNLLTPQAGDTLFTNALKIYGQLDTIINSASIFLEDTIDNFSDDLWHKHQTIHVTVPMILTQLLTKHIKTRPESSVGNVINLIDQRIKRPTPAFFSYTASKMFMASLTVQCAIACSPFVRVNGIAPGSTLPSPRQTQSDFLKQASLTPLQKPVSLDDITNAVMFILNSHSVTGEIIILDSGQNFDWQTKNFLQCKE
jgi:NAD(P)-dependent dehydrogenase (short-subunit alcohol dehydrogenase family)